ncbi:MAG: GxxExxY protein [Acidobacteriota bacterium]
MLEVLYGRALAYEFGLRYLSFKREVLCRVFYKEQPLGDYRIDFVVGDAILVEIKALPQLTKMHYAQAYNYLVGTGLEVGLLLNFGTFSLEYKRLLCTESRMELKNL